ncbi:salicylic acid-binding protein 2-like [Vigna umbellata]|uniref:salicylic acid-binding protein 2-like n=1 Tax=Vigna umbellata TaxID=87088 RepID=UPI001F5E744A|nr:salicylic acid-binding protein 2-like [Vigna umbellata]
MVVKVIFYFPRPHGGRQNVSAERDRGTLLLPPSRNTPPPPIGLPLLASSALGISVNGLTCSKHFDAQLIESTLGTNWLDTEFSKGENKTTIVFGPKFLSEKLYQASSIEDIELATILLRPGSLFIEDLSQQTNFSMQRYGSVPLVFIVSTEDNEIPLNFQLWMIQNAGMNVEVLEIKGADHMLMISKPQELSHSLLHIATKYA